MRCIAKIIFLFLFFGYHLSGVTKPLSKIEIVDGKFVNEQGDRFFLWGFNYTSPVEGVLLEDRWEEKEIWNAIEEDFQEMKDLGANVVRFALQYHQFMKDSVTPNRKALKRLERLVRIAEEKEIYLLIAGLGAFRKSDQPDWYNNMNDRERWDTQKVFWKAIAKQVGKYHSVFAYDLMNEPVVSVRCKELNACEWTGGQAMGGFHFVQNISRNPENKFHDTILRWSGELRQAIRSVDDKTLITIGFLSMGDLTPFAETLDFICPHIYPRKGKIDASIQFIEKNQTSVPLVITETSATHCGEEGLKEFIDRIDGKYEGLVGHYFGKTPEEKCETIQEAVLMGTVKFFIKYNPNK